MLDPEKTHEMGALNRKYVQENFHIRSIAQKFEEILLKLDVQICQ